MIKLITRYRRKPRLLDDDEHTLQIFQSYLFGEWKRSGDSDNKSFLSPAKFLIMHADVIAVTRPPKRSRRVPRNYSYELAQ